MQREHLIDLGVLGLIERVRKLAKMAWSVPLEEQEQMAQNFQQIGMAIPEEAKAGASIKA